MGNDADDTLFSGLQELTAGSFPKVCPSCGRVYEDLEQFLEQTVAINGKTGLKASVDDDEHTVVELFRNCVCGSTLMDFCQSRRDESADGIRRRETFARMMALLVQRGVAREKARGELLAVVRGGRSDLIERLLKSAGKRKGKD